MAKEISKQDFERIEKKIEEILRKNDGNKITNLFENGEIFKYIDYILKEIKDKKIRYVNLANAWETVQKMERFLENKSISELKIFFEEKEIEFLYRKAVLLYEFKRDFKEAQKLFLKISKTENKYKYRSLYYLALIYLETGNTEKAKKIYEKLKNILPKIEKTELIILQQMVENLTREINRLYENQTFLLITNETRSYPERKKAVKISDNQFKKKYDLFVNYDEEKVYVNGNLISNLKRKDIEIILCMALSDEICSRKNFVKQKSYLENIEVNSLYKRIQRLIKKLKENGIEIEDFRIKNDYCIAVNENAYRTFCNRLKNPNL